MTTAQNTPIGLPTELPDTAEAVLSETLERSLLPVDAFDVPADSETPQNVEASPSAPLSDTVVDAVKRVVLGLTE